MATLLEECLETLGLNVVIIPEPKANLILKSFAEKMPVLTSGSLDWGKLDFIEFENCFALSSILSEGLRNKEVIIIWDDAATPLIKTNLGLALDEIDEITAVANKTYFWLLDSVIEQVFPTERIRVSNPLSAILVQRREQ